jgi:hypothetical protein
LRPKDSTRAASTSAAFEAAAIRAMERDNNSCMDSSSM